MRFLEQDETNNLLISCKDCEVRPANPIQPVLKWKWQAGTPTIGNTITSTPLVTNLTDDNGDGRIDQHDVPSLVFVGYGQTGGIGGGQDPIGKLLALRGDTGAAIFTVLDLNHPFLTSAHPVIGDINNDGLPEIVIVGSGYGGQGLFAFNYRGELLWDNRQMVADWRATNTATRLDLNASSVPAIADIDGDGTPRSSSDLRHSNHDGSVRFGYRSTYGTGSGSWILRIGRR